MSGSRHGVARWALGVLLPAAGCNLVFSADGPGAERPDAAAGIDGRGEGPDADPAAPDAAPFLDRAVPVVIEGDLVDVAECSPNADGSRLVFTARAAAGGDRAIYVADASEPTHGTSAVEVTASNGAILNPSTPRFADDGGSYADIVYGRELSDQRTLIYLNGTGANAWSELARGTGFEGGDIGVAPPLEPGVSSNARIIVDVGETMGSTSRALVEYMGAPQGSSIFWTLLEAPIGTVLDTMVNLNATYQRPRNVFATTDEQFYFVAETGTTSAIYRVTRGRDAVVTEATQVFATQDATLGAPGRVATGYYVTVTAPVALAGCYYVPD